jgi:hypothetical protein
VSYRAQFAYPPAPAGFHDEDFIHYYDAISTPTLGSILPAGATLRDIPLVLETDADFIARGIRIFGFVDFQLREPNGAFLSEQPPANPPSLFHSYLGGGIIIFPAGPMELPTVPLESEIVCPAGSAFLLYLYNPTGGPTPVNGTIAIFGVKRYADCAN